MSSYTINLPMPPSVNAMFVNRSAKDKRGRMLSPAYVKWRKEADGALWTQKPLVNFPGPVGVCMAFEIPKALRDLDGCPKGVLDFLVRHGIIKEDNHKIVKMLLLTWDKNIKGAKITVTDMA